MINKKTILKVITPIAALSVGVVGFTIPSQAVAADKFSGNLNVQVYGDWPFVQKDAAAFMKLHPNAKITVGGITNDQIRSGGGRLFTSSESPDIVSYTLQTPLMNDLIAANALTPLDDVWKAAGIAKSVSSTTVKLATAGDGKKYSVPLGLTLLPYIFYNVDAWKKVGATLPDAKTHAFKTLADFNSSMAKLKSAGYTALNTAGDPFIEYLLGQPLQSSCGTALYTKISLNWQAPNAPKYTQPCVVKAIQQVMDWSKAGYFPDGLSSLSYSQSQALFDTGKAATWVQGSWVPPVYEPKGFKWDWAMFPSLGGEATAHGVSLDSFLVPAGSKNVPLAKEFIKYMIQKNVLENGMGRVPARTDVNLSKVITSKTEISIANAANVGKQAPGWFTMIPPEVEQAVGKAITSGAMAGTMTAAQAAQALQDAADSYRKNH